ncbi:hypothetical protein GSI_08374 [Ganoderma sinense ZZ0214-1]|uniref:DDE Tnp4 domain-containing protein n=1 Tax=Ganoderma sinense ZZ0214-1 TaxID=1077348 RepID=A0A2G8S6M7_9APHY|nr:hypothetical protein GSI_08374 [Ganoderma sinense ZZ0214-1]
MLDDLSLDGMEEWDFDLLDDFSGEDGDDEAEEDDDEDELEDEDEDEEGDTMVQEVRGPAAPPPSRLGRHVQQAIGQMYSSHYEAARNTLPRGPAFLSHVLHVYKQDRPDKFREELRVSPSTFDRLVSRLAEDPVFSNNSENPQMPVETQVAIALWRFGRYGNSASLQHAANWAGCGKGTVDLVTRRVMTAVLRSSFLEEYICLPTEEEKAKAKEWVESHSCKAWRDGWCMVDGTLVPLDERPFWYGESYFDRKCNYSLNVQIVSLPNLRIIDVGYGYTGSTHDATAWRQTKMAQNHADILEDGEFIFADSAYPLEIFLVEPYKMPEREEPDNEVFNNHISIVRIRSEHAIGFLKGRFQSLKGLHVRIKDARSHKFATYWILVCIALHSFAMACEEEERAERGEDSEEVDNDPFIQEGLSSTSESDNNRPPVSVNRGGTRVQAARVRREELKEALFRDKEKRAERRRRR